MKKNILALCMMALLYTATSAQTAPDFTATDCDGITHNLYTEVNSGKVIVLNWIMPCSACIGPSMTAYNIVENYSLPNVLYYLIDDAGNTSCITMSGWATNNGIGSSRSTFSTSAIVENNYGGVGMPHVAVVGYNGAIFFNGLNGAAGNVTGIQNAIDAALLAATAIDEQDVNVFSLSLFPNPSSDKVLLNYAMKESSEVSFNILSETGQAVATYPAGRQVPGKHEFQFDVKHLASGNYFVRIISEQKTQAYKFTVSH